VAKEPVSLAKTSISLIATAFLLSGCGITGVELDPQSDDSQTIVAQPKEFTSALFSKSEFVNVNNGAAWDASSSFSLFFEDGEFVAGDIEMVEQANWRSATDIFPSECESEYSWRATTVDSQASNGLWGMLVNLSAIEMTTRDFNDSIASVAGQYIYVYSSAPLAEQAFKEVSQNMRLCSSGARAMLSDGNLLDLSISEAPNQAFRYFTKGEYALRHASGELQSLDLFIKAGHVVHYFKIFINDLRLDSKSKWKQLDEFVNQPLQRSCLIQALNCPDFGFQEITSAK
jgi:hypothetical protein